MDPNLYNIFQKYNTPICLAWKLHKKTHRKKYKKSYVKDLNWPTLFTYTTCLFDSPGL